MVRPLLERYDDHGDGTVTVHSHTDDGVAINIVIGRDQFGSQDMYDMLTAAGARAHTKNNALRMAQHNDMEG